MAKYIPNITPEQLALLKEAAAKAAKYRKEGTAVLITAGTAAAAMVIKLIRELKTKKEDK